MQRAVFYDSFKQITDVQTNIRYKKEHNNSLVYCAKLTLNNSVYGDKYKESVYLLDPQSVLSPVKLCI